MDSSGDVFLIANQTEIMERTSAGTWSTVTNGPTGTNVLMGITGDKNGNLYVTVNRTDGSSAVEEYTATSSSPRWIDLTNGESFKLSDGIAVDSAGDVFVTDIGSNKIFELPQGTTAWQDISGSGSFQLPYSLAADPTGTKIYVLNETTSGPYVTVEEGDYTGNTWTWTDITSNLQFSTQSDPEAWLSVDSSGNLYAESSYPFDLSEYKDGTWTDPTNGATINPNYEAGLGIDGSGNFYTASTQTNHVYELMPTSAPTGLASQNTTATGTTLTWDAYSPTPSYYNVYQNGVLLNNLYPTTNQADISGLTPGNSYSFTVTAVLNDPLDGQVETPQSSSIQVKTALPNVWQNITGNATLTDPDFLWTDAQGNIFATDVNGNHFMELPEGGYSWSNVPTYGMKLNGPFGVTTDSAGNLYLTNAGNTNSGTVVELKVGATSWTDLTDGHSFNRPEGVAVDTRGDIFVANYNSGEIDELPAGTSEWKVFYQAPASSTPSDLYFDSNGNLYLVEPGANKIMEFVSSGGNLASSPTDITNGGSFNSPYQITQDSQGNLYVTNYGASQSGAPAVEELPSGKTNWIDASHSGTGTDLDAPVGITFDKSGDMVVANFNGTQNQNKLVEAYGPAMLRMSSSATIVPTGGQVTVQGSTSGVASQQVSLAATGGTFGSDGASTTVNSDTNGMFSSTWNAPTTPGIYTLSGTAFGTTVHVTVDVTQYINGAVTTTPVMTNTSSPLDSSFTGLANPNGSSSNIHLAIPAGALPSGTPVWVTSTSDASQITPKGTQVVATAGVNFSGTPTQPIVLTITNPSIKPGDQVYEILPGGTYRQVTNGVTVSAGQATVAFQSDPNFIVAQPLQVAVNAPPAPPTIIQNAITEQGQVNQPYSMTIHEIGGLNPLVWSIANGNLPPGLVLNNQGVISGTPTTSGTYTFAVKVTDAGQRSSTSQPLSITITAPLSIVQDSILPPGKPSQSYQQPLTAIGGVAPYTWSIATGTLPQGLQLNSETGAIQGMTSVIKPALVTVGVRDSSGESSQKLFVVDALPANEREIVWEDSTLQAENVPAVVGTDAGTDTTYMPIWYVMQLLKSMGIQSAWDGTHWHLTTSSTADLSNVQVGSGHTSIYLNGTLVQLVNTVAQNDPSTGRHTTYMPIWYVEQILHRVGLTSTWNGTTWVVTQQNS